MPSIITLGFTTVPDEQFATLIQLLEKAREVIGCKPGVLSLSVWKDLDLPERYVMMGHHANEEVARAALDDQMEQKVLEDIINSMDMPPDMRAVRIDHQHGHGPSDTVTGTIMSVSIRRAEPGYGADLRQEIHDIFLSLELMEGYRGSAYGANLALAEEMYGIVFWSNRRAFEASVPGRAPYELQLMERIA